ncbi:hypothetical protein M3201_18565 [Paenibacillus motobuensis]|uniref:hypothetical protein n=1 Tax=Paenibacillus TaxID=44249 RepID=UPI00203E6932|nr:MULTISPECIES: hypothetical protein [Paenibacillus]MCM3041700.1 hypothetical protein [Paenibacillus lutimineralis]MCM3648804.1 hypothetical protein [Paenibacillus motobuensis]
MGDIMKELRSLLTGLTDELHTIALKDDPETNNIRTKLIAKRELVIELLSKYD